MSKEFWLVQTSPAAAFDNDGIGWLRGSPLRKRLLPWTSNIEEAVHYESKELAELDARCVWGRQWSHLAIAIKVREFQPKSTAPGRWVYTDDRGERYRIADDVILECIRDNEFYHPTSGNRVFDFRTNLTLE